MRFEMRFRVRGGRDASVEIRRKSYRVMESLGIGIDWEIPIGFKDERYGSFLNIEIP